MTRRPEAALERHVLLALGHEPDVWLARNEVGVGYHGCVRQLIERALAPFPTAATAVREILQRNRVSYGLGVGSPDLVCSVGGWLDLWELKSERGALSPEQSQFHAAARGRGINVEVIRSVEDARTAVERARQHSAGRGREERQPRPPPERGEFRAPGAMVAIPHNPGTKA